MSSNSSSVIKIRLTDVNKQKVEEQAALNVTNFKLSDTLVKALVQKYHLGELLSCTLIIGANNIAVSVLEYTLTDTVYIEGFYNMPSYISILQAKSANIHITDQHIKLLQADCKRVLLADCQIDQLNLGLREFPISKGTSADKLEFESVDIRNAQIRSVQLYMDCKSFNVQRSNIEMLNMYGTMNASATSLENLSVWLYSHIGVMTLQYNVHKFKLEGSTIDKLIAKAGCFLHDIEINDGIILDAYNWSELNFANVDISGWELVAKSAENQGLLDKRADAQYEISRYLYQQGAKHRKVFGGLMDFCTGFGYKPFRAIRACAVMAFIAWILLMIFDFVELRQNVGITVVKDLIIAITAIAGQSGLTISDGISYWIAFVEYIGGVVLFAMFVNALYIRYKD